jgi:5-methyltetrahydrofolate--homocysteine methyltransferase
MEAIGMMDEAIKQRYRAFWANERFERACLFITVPKKDAAEPDPADLLPGEPDGAAISTEQRWTDFPHLNNRMWRSFGDTEYLAEGFRNVWVNLGPGYLAAMMGADYRFAPDTVWFGEKPLISDWGQLGGIRYDAAGEAGALAFSLTKSYCERSRGRYVVGMTDLGGNLDIVASLRGTQELLTDLYDYPEQVLEAARLVDAAWKAAYDGFYAIHRRHNPCGCLSTWMPIYCEKRWYPLQCDFSAMISPDDFERFVAPSLRREAEFLDCSVYHLDGPGELPHLGHLLGIEGISAIQWVPGAGNLGMAEDCWFPYYERIQAAGKGLVLFGINGFDEACFMLRNLSQKGLYMSLQLESAEQAEELMAYAAAH